MKRLLLLSLLLAAATFAASSHQSAAVAAPGDDGPVYEMRTYWAHPGKLDALHARFRDHTVRLFEKHGMRNLGYWTPIENPDQKLVYVIQHAGREARQKAFQAFGADPEWQKARAESEANGPLVAKAESVLLRATDYSPPIRPSKADERVFELRVYTASAGNLGRLNARFRDHTLALFAKHGMTNVAYWNVLAGEKGADTMLIYFLAHRSREAARASFSAFGQDPAWVAARSASEAAAGGSLTAPSGVKSTFLSAVDYSPTR